MLRADICSSVALWCLLGSQARPLRLLSQPCLLRTGPWVVRGSSAWPDVAPGPAQPQLGQAGLLLASLSVKQDRPVAQGQGMVFMMSPTWACAWCLTPQRSQVGALIKGSTVHWS